ncbi:hypothetical protein JOH52_007050 [Sinorhizobium meliloti]|nr:hypothetical protein [Sinorhizobium meliloti]
MGNYYAPRRQFRVVESTPASLEIWTSKNAILVMSFRACLYGRSGRRLRRGHGGGGSMSLRIQCNSMSCSTRVMLEHVHFNLGHIPSLRSSSHTLAGVSQSGRPNALTWEGPLQRWYPTAQVGHSPPRVQSHSRFSIWPCLLLRARCPSTRSSKGRQSCRRPRGPLWVWICAQLPNASMIWRSQRKAQTNSS